MTYPELIEADLEQFELDGYLALLPEEWTPEVWADWKDRCWPKGKPAVRVTLGRDTAHIEIRLRPGQELTDTARRLMREAAWDYPGRVVPTFGPGWADCYGVPLVAMPTLVAQFLEAIEAEKSVTDTARDNQ